MQIFSEGEAGLKVHMDETTVQKIDKNLAIVTRHYFVDYRQAKRCEFVESSKKIFDY